ncbi:cadmium resistance transporter [Streptomyces sp. NPDC048448]|uniref:cadmium resistance transporter n=1 Tax=Streptomyces sp. NPDC048448 TaxID=3365554 RepID=UPI00371B0501
MAGPAARRKPLAGRSSRSHGATREGGPGPLEVAAVTFANGGDNIGVYVPVFATAGVGGLTVYAVVFFMLIAVWCFAGKFFVTRPVIAKAPWPAESHPAAPCPDHH